ncbi:succinyl-diaminopimelate desuccinylase [Legionella septentrionalis]|uniref:Succinyl-diaminopimelate desuccinylase n=1 Tax=Legionella septentrionalis TaxID=2498109 RepID=A0A3S0XRV3_9GAMM|nr:succinyl-diaminopimelate desuccinylase [Legionella septentrionalis]RUQ80993.1 succinyl-diaminopimelate desuccinylase [Legionella septentrionalis]
MTEIRELLAALISFPSITPRDEGCQEYMIAYLEKAGFQCQRFNCDPVANFFACYGTHGPLLLFAGHSDVVPAGDRAKWARDPFALTEENGVLFGRGTADMKGSLACMMTAASHFIKKYPDFPGRLGFLITSGEEGDQFDLGTPYVMAHLKEQGIHPDYCIVGEPSSSKMVGDVIKIGRRGSLTAKIVVHGKQGHVAYPHLAENPIHKVIPALQELTAYAWDAGNRYFPPTSLQITHIEAGGQAGNIIPGTLTLQFNLRYSTEQTAKLIEQQVQACFSRYDLNAEITWRLNGEPFLTDHGRLLDCTLKSIKFHMDFAPELSTSGGTSDGRFIAPYGVEVIELGPVNETIHQINECVSLNELLKLGDIYYTICEELFAV